MSVYDCGKGFKVLVLKLFIFAMVWHHEQQILSFELIQENNKYELNVRVKIKFANNNLCLIFKLR